MRTLAFALGLAALLAAGSVLLPLGSAGEEPLPVPPVPPAATPEPPVEPEPTAEATPPPAPEPTPVPEPATTPDAAPTPEVEAPATPAPAEPPPVTEARAAEAPQAVPAQTVSVCHYTGSSTAPYVLVEAPSGGGEHQAHPDDLIPAPSGGCPTTYQGPRPPQQEPEPEPTPSGRVTLCHATGQASNPYVELTIRRSRVAEHERHRADIIPAPEGGCPTRAEEDASAPQAPARPRRPRPAPTPSPAPRPRRRANAPVQAAPPPAAAAAPVTVSAPAPAPALVSGLPNTGAESGLLLLMGLGFISMGAGLRLLSADDG